MDCEGPYYPSHGHKQSCLKQEQIQRSLQGNWGHYLIMFQSLRLFIDELVFRGPDTAAFAASIQYGEDLNEINIAKDKVSQKLIEHFHWLSQK